MAFFNYPFTIIKNTPAIAGEVQTNFDHLLTWIMGNLIQKDGSIAMTGPLVLAPGAPASPDHAANKAYVDGVIPIGVVWEFAGTALPAGWLWCDGATYSNTSQPKLSSAIGRTYTDAAVPTGSFQVPDKRKRVTVGADASEAVVFGLGVKGGQRNSELQSHFHTVPSHGHTASSADAETPNHLHTAGGYNAIGVGDHDHGMGHGSIFWRKYNQGALGVNLRGPGDPYWVGFAETTWYNQGAHGHGLQSTSGAADRSLAHAHGVSVNGSGALQTDAFGAGTSLTDKNLPPYIALNYIIYAGG